MDRIPAGAALPTGGTMLPPPPRTTAESPVQSQESGGARLGQGQQPLPATTRPLVSTKPSKRRRRPENSVEARPVRSRQGDAPVPISQELRAHPGSSVSSNLMPNQRTILQALTQRPGMFLTSHDMAEVTSLSVKEVGDALASMQRRIDCKGLLEMKMYGNKVRGYRLNPSWQPSGGAMPAPRPIRPEDDGPSLGAGDTKSLPQLPDLSGMAQALMADTQRLLREAEYHGRIGQSTYLEGVASLMQAQPQVGPPRTDADPS